MQIFLNNIATIVTQNCKYIDNLQKIGTFDHPGEAEVEKAILSRASPIVPALGWKDVIRVKMEIPLKQQAIIFVTIVYWSAFSSVLLEV